MIIGSLIVGCLLMALDQILYLSPSIPEMSNIGKIGSAFFCVGLLIYPASIIIGLFKNNIDHN